MAGSNEPWLERARRRGVPEDAVLDTFAEHGIIQTMQHPNGELRMPAFPVRFDGGPAPLESAPLLASTPSRSAAIGSA